MSTADVIDLHDEALFSTSFLIISKEVSWEIYKLKKKKKKKQCSILLPVICFQLNKQMIFQ